MAVTREALIEIGTRWSSSLVLAEAELALHRWREDVARLRLYGWGEKRRAQFEALVDRLRARHEPPDAEGSQETLAQLRAVLAQARGLRELLDPEAASDELYAAGETAVYTLEAALGGPAQPPAESTEHRDELDALDGEIYLTIRGLNRAGRRLFRADGNEGRAGRYVFQFLVTIGRDEDEPRPAGEGAGAGAAGPVLVLRGG
jgi:hypothetical protein